MQSTAAFSDFGSVYRSIARVVFKDLRACLYRLQHLIVEVGPTATAGLTARRLARVRTLINALGHEYASQERSQEEPAMPSPHVYDACIHTLDRIEQQAMTDPATACDSAIRLLDVVAREVEWLTRA